MPTPAECIKMAASLQNDTKQSVYNNGSVLPYFNMALNDLQEIFEQNDISVTHEQSAILAVNAGVTSIEFSGTVPVLPANLVEIIEVWESARGQNSFIPLTRRGLIPHSLDNIQVTNFAIWAWVDNAIKLPNSIQDNDLKLDYIKSIFSEATLGTVNTELGVRFKNCKSYLGYRTAALCSMFIGENETRAIALTGEADTALGRSLGIAVKSNQAIQTRRRPFRASFKRRSGLA